MRAWDAATGAELACITHDGVRPCRYIVVIPREYWSSAELAEITGPWSAGT